MLFGSQSGIILTVPLDPSIILSPAALEGPQEPLGAPPVNDPADLWSPLPFKPISSPAMPTNARAVLSTPQDTTRVIRMILDRAGMSQSEVGDRLGITQQSINQYATGRRTAPSLNWVARLAEVCGARLLIEWPSLKD